MSEARLLIASLKERLGEMQEEYDGIENKNSSDARVLSADIEELEGIIREYESFLNRYENVSFENDFARQRYDETMNDVVNRLRAFNEGYATRDDIINTTGLESRIENIASRSDASEEISQDSSDVSGEQEEVAEEPVLTDDNREQPELQAAEESSPANNEVEEIKASDIEYQNIMNERIQKIEKKLNKLKTKMDLTGKKAEAIRGLEIELEALRHERDNYQDRTRLGAEVEENLAAMDEQHAENVSQIKNYDQEIKELKDLREQLTSRKDKRQIKKLMKSLEAKKIDLKVQDKAMTNTEGLMMAPGYKDEMEFRTKAAREEGIISTNADRLAINEELRDMLDPENKIIDSIKDRFYDIQGNHYRKKIDKAQARLEELQSGDIPIRLNGARTIGLTREYLEGLRRNRDLQNDASMQMAA